jgi:hypothetical protein
MVYLLNSCFFKGSNKDVFQLILFQVLYPWSWSDGFVEQSCVVGRHWQNNVLEIGLMQSGLLKKFAVIALYNTVTA